MTSAGLLTLELPAVSERDGLSDPVRALIRQVEPINSFNMNGVDMTPIGNSTYVGTFAMLFNDDPTVVSRETEVSVNMAGNVATVSMTPLNVESPSFSLATGNIIGAGPISGGFYSSTLSGTLVGDLTETYDVTGGFDGVFVAGGQTIAGFSGTATSPDDTEGFTGFFEASRQ